MCDIRITIYNNGEWKCLRRLKWWKLNINYQINHTWIPMRQKTNGSTADWMLMYIYFFSNRGNGFYLLEHRTLFSYVMLNWHYNGVTVSSFTFDCHWNIQMKIKKILCFYPLLAIPNGFVIENAWHAFYSHVKLDFIWIHRVFVLTAV